MSGTFDAYHRWLGITPAEQPPNAYRLLGLRPFESDPEVIETAADRQMLHLRTYQLGEHAELSERLLNEVAAARIMLLDKGKKAAYDKRLSAELPAAVPAATVPSLETLDELPASSEVALLGVPRPSGPPSTRPVARRPFRRLPHWVFPVVAVVVLLGASIGLLGYAINAWIAGGSSAPNSTEQNDSEWLPPEQSGPTVRLPQAEDDDPEPEPTIVIESPTARTNRPGLGGPRPLPEPPRDRSNPGRAVE